MLRHHDEAGVLQQVDVEDALIDRAVPQHLHDRAQSGRHRLRVGQFRYVGRAPEGLERPDAAAHEVTNDGGDQAARQRFGSRPTDSTPSVVSNTASALTGPDGKCRARGTARGGA